MAGVTDFSNSKESLIAKIKKRDGRVVSFEHAKIANAIYKALVATGKPDYPLAERLAGRVVQKMVQQSEKTGAPSVEDVQDMVESILIEEGLSETAKSYILYRHERHGYGRHGREDSTKILELDDRGVREHTTIWNDNRQTIQFFGPIGTLNYYSVDTKHNIAPSTNNVTDPSIPETHKKLKWRSMIGPYTLRAIEIFLQAASVGIQLFFQNSPNSG